MYDLERRKANAARSELRSAAQGTGERSDKIRTYHWPQDRVTDHRIGVTIPGVMRVVSGEHLDELIEVLVSSDESERVENFLKKAVRNSG